MKYKIAFSRMKLDHKIQPGESIWREFNASFDNLDIEGIEIANFIYLGHAFTTWHRDRWRTSANYQLGQHLAIDFDTEDDRSRLNVLVSDRFIAKYAHCIYTTPSHTPDRPRARVLFLLDSPIHQAKNYAAAASALLWLFGAADRQCKDPARFFYGSINADFEYLDNQLPLTVVKDLIAKYSASGAVVKHQHTRSIDAPANQNEVAEMLKAIPPWGIDYDEWVEVLMALHVEFGDAGLALATQWADGQPGEVERKWRSFKTTGNPAGRVTIGTVAMLAKQHGWQRRKAA